MSARRIVELADTLPHIARAMTKSVRFGIYDDEGTVEFACERGGYLVEGCGRVWGVWHTQGNGYDSPYEDYITDGGGCIDELSATLTDTATNETTDLPPSETEAFRQMLENELNDYMKYRF